MVAGHEPDAGPYEPALGGDRLRHDVDPPAETLPETETASETTLDRLAHIPESGTSNMSPFEQRLTDLMAMVIVGLGFLLIVAFGVAVIATLVRYTWGLFHP